MRAFRAHSKLKKNAGKSRPRRAQTLSDLHREHGPGGHCSLFRRRDSRLKKNVRDFCAPIPGLKEPMRKFRAPRPPAGGESFENPKKGHLRTQGHLRTPRSFGPPGPSGAPGPPGAARPVRAARATWGAWAAWAVRPAGAAWAAWGRLGRLGRPALLGRLGRLARLGPPGPSGPPGPRVLRAARRV